MVSGWEDKTGDVGSAYLRPLLDALKGKGQEFSFADREGGGLLGSHIGSLWIVCL
jgi:hypothetical protein